MIPYFPKYFSSRAIYLYIVLLLVVPIVFGHPMKWYWWLFGLVEVISFFYCSNRLTLDWGRYSNRLFEKKLLSTSLAIRLVYVLFSYFFYKEMTGTQFDFNAGDVLFYDEMGRYGHRLISLGHFPTYLDLDSYSGGLDLSDTGYPYYLILIYSLTNNSIVAVRLIKAVISAWTAVIVYRIAKRNFGETTGRMSGVFCMLMPNLIYYCGVHLKETEMLFLVVVFVERADLLIRSSKISIVRILLVALVGFLVFFFRAVLCYVLFLALATAIVLSSKRIVKWGRNIIISSLAIVLVGIVFYNNLVERNGIEQYDNLTEQQATNMEWRSERKGGNQFAKYAGSAVFAPLIFTIPFPTMIDIPYQQGQQMIHGGNYVKNITSFFTIIALILLVLSGKWREHVLPASFLMGYLIVLVFSAYAQSERFHIPILPFSLMFAAYGVSQMKNKHKTLFMYWMLFIFVANIGWAWFKLRGRGM